MTATQICKASELKEQILESHHQGKQKNADKAEKHRTETMQCREKYDKWKPEFVKMMQKYESVWDGHSEKTTVAKHRSVLNPLDALPIHSAPYRTGPKQQKLERVEGAQVEKAGVAEPSVTEWASPIVFGLRKDRSLRSCVDFCRLNAVIVRDS